MLHARPDYDHIQDPTGKIGEDEPVFLLRAKDQLAPEALYRWATRLEEAGGQPLMVKIAREHAEHMEAWQKVNGCKLPDMPIG